MFWTTGKKTAERTVLAAVGLFVCLFVLAAARPALAVTQEELGLTTNAAASFGLTTTDIREVIGNIISVFLGLLGLVMVVLMLYAGFLYMTSQGNEEQVSKAKAIIRNAVIGLIIIVLAFAITRFIINAITGEGGGIFGPGGGGDGAGFAVGAGRAGRSALGNGIIEYHYPEPGQSDVPRNTKIAITFKKPIALSTVFKNYDDKGTLAVSDDVLCSPDCATAGHAEAAVTTATVLSLNTANIKIIAQENLGQIPGSGSDDEKFDARYPDGVSQVGGAITDPAPRAKTTVLVSTSAAFDANERQTLAITLIDPLGSATTDVNYRVALRGGANGVKVWVPKASGDPAGDPPQKKVPALPTSFADGGYYWPFTTGTTLDVTPPKIVSVNPFAVPTGDLGDSGNLVFRNQLLAIYFDEAVDPTSASGLTGAGAGRGFNKIEVQARCRAGTTCGGWTSGGTPVVLDDTFVAVPGEVRLSNRYRTAEFIPETPCDTVSINSCGEKVYCLPKNAELRVTVRAAAISTATPPSPEPPTASEENGVLDMVGNSFDGNRDGAAQGPAAADGDVYPMNPPAPASLTGIKDTASWFYHTGDAVDLVPPLVTEVDPLSYGDSVFESAFYSAGPSKVPVSTPVVVTWSKTMSPSSFRTGTLDQVVPPDTATDPKPSAAVTFKAYECPKSAAPCTGANSTLEPPSFSIAYDPPTETDSDSEMTINHAPFLTSNDLGYTETDTMTDATTPKYSPIVGAQVRDDRQNCFYPSQGYACDMAGTETIGGVDTEKQSCCNRLGWANFRGHGCN
ncbi:hypothetical protein HY633_04105 [Candidatus Uhrbacteria bacterium]|nr:hypothetical protein [Candidatus Uhrbacteria bacterium]